MRTHFIKFRDTSAYAWCFECIDNRFTIQETTVVTNWLAVIEGVVSVGYESPTELAIEYIDMQDGDFFGWVLRERDSRR